MSDKTSYYNSNENILKQMFSKIHENSNFEHEIFATDLENKVEFIGILSIKPIFSFKLYYFFGFPIKLSEEALEFGVLYGGKDFDDYLPYILEALAKRKLKLRF